MTLAFALAMALVLAGTGAFLYLRLGSELSQQLDQNLRSRADDIGALVQQADSALSQSGTNRLTETGESLAQVIDANGRVLDATPPLTQPLLTPAELTHARSEALFVDRRTLAGLDEPVRLLARPIDAQGQRLVIVVGASLDERASALAELRSQLLIGGPVALALASLAGYLLAAAALRPVDSMRRRATAITAATPGERLPVPAANDEIRRLGETLNEMLERLAAALERERQFVADASHELRTPLALMKTELELALRRTRSPEELRDALASAAEETDRLTRLAEDLLVIARSDQNGLALRSAEIDAGEILAGVAERFTARAAQAHRPLTVDAPDGLLLVADKLRVEQAIGNLVDNALRYGAGTVTLRTASTDGTVELHVTDEGPGFPEAFLPRAFERFSRADEARTRGGTGLGLSIVDVIARAHGGSAHAENRRNGGADVWITLPAGPDAANRR